MAKGSAARKTQLSGRHPRVAAHPRARHLLDRLIHERMRLGIVSALAANNSLTFNELKKLLQTTDGNVSVHARKLEEAGYISCEKSFEGRMPRTEYRLTASRAQGAAQIPGPHGSADRRNAAEIAVHSGVNQNEQALRLNTLCHKELFTSRLSWTEMAVGRPGAGYRDLPDIAGGQRHWIARCAPRRMLGSRI